MNAYSQENNVWGAPGAASVYIYIHDTNTIPTSHRTQIVLSQAEDNGVHL